MASPRIQFRPGKELTDQLLTLYDLPSNLDEKARDVYLNEANEEVVKMYFYFLRQHVPQFSMGEACLLFDALNGIIPQYQVSGYLWVEIRDAIEMDHLDEKWHVDGSQLLARLELIGSTHPFASWAIIQAVRLAWSGPYHIYNVEERLVKVGLVRPSKEG